MAVIAILAALLLPSLANAKASARSAACKSNLRHLGVALITFTDEHKHYPADSYRVCQVDKKMPLTRRA